MMRRFREFPTIGGRRGGGIPADCVEVQYLESTGTQYIKTGFCPDNTCGIRVEAAALNRLDSVVVGCRSSSNERWWVNFGSSVINISWCSYGTTNINYELGRSYRIENNYLNSRVFSVDGVACPTSLYSQYTLADSNREAYIFGANSIGTFTLQNLFRVYYCKLSRGSIVERDFVPVRRVENGVSVGYMCDRITGELYGNQGTGAFVIGPDAGAVSARDYVQDGLIAMWDGIENAGWGTHDANATSWVDLVAGTAVTLPSAFEVKEDRIEIRSSGSLRLNSWNPSGSFTVEYAFAPYDTNTNRECLFESATANSGFRYKKTTTVADFWNGYGVNHPIWTVSAGTRVHIASTFDRQSSKYVWNDYINGTMNGSGNITSANVVAMNGFQIGRPSAPGYTTYQDILCVRLYDRALTASEIASNHAVDAERFGIS